MNIQCIVFCYKHIISLQIRNKKLYESVNSYYILDDRIDFPKTFFLRGCHCQPKFYGADCGECWFGRNGTDCNDKVYYTRRNIFSFTADEKAKYVNILQHMRSEDSGYDVIVENQDKKLTVQSASLLHYIVHVHYYAARNTLFESQSFCMNQNFINYSHGGPGFLLWHRMFMLIWERRLRRIAQRLYNWNDFAIPYWDWIDATWCEVCTKDLLGEEGPVYKSSRSMPPGPFQNWTVYCPFKTDCEVCPVGEGIKLTREFISFFFPTTADTDFTLSHKVYHIQENDSCVSFSSALGGDCAPPNSPPYMAKIGYMHNRIHFLINGPFCCSTSPNDPIFIFHHSQVSVR